MSFIPLRRLPRPGWAFLPPELHSRILLHLPKKGDQAAFSITCTTWNTEAEQYLYAIIWFDPGVRQFAPEFLPLLVRTLRESRRLGRLVREVYAKAFCGSDRMCALYRLLRLTPSLEVLNLKIGGDAGLTSAPWSKFRFRATLRVLGVNAWILRQSEPEEVAAQVCDETFAEFLAKCPNLMVLSTLDVGFSREHAQTPTRLKRLRLEGPTVTTKELETYLSALIDGSVLKIEYTHNNPLSVLVSELIGFLVSTGGRLKELELQTDLRCFSEQDLGMLFKSCYNLDVLKVSAYDFAYMMRHMWPPRLKRIALLRVRVDPQPTSFPYSWRWLDELPKTMKDLTVHYDWFSWNDRGGKLPMQAVKMFKKAKIDLGMKVSLLNGNSGFKVVVARNRDVKPIYLGYSRAPGMARTDDSKSHFCMKYLPVVLELGHC